MIKILQIPKTVRPLLIFFWNLLMEVNSALSLSLELFWYPPYENNNFGIFGKWKRIFEGWVGHRSHPWKLRFSLQSSFFKI